MCLGLLCRRAFTVGIQAQAVWYGLGETVLLYLGQNRENSSAGGSERPWGNGPHVLRPNEMGFTLARFASGFVPRFILPTHGR